MSKAVAIMRVVTGNLPLAATRRDCFGSHLHGYLNFVLQLQGALGYVCMCTCRLNILLLAIPGAFAAEYLGWSAVWRFSLVSWGPDESLPLSLSVFGASQRQQTCTAASPSQTG